jgi:hypothetical protein
MAGSTHLTSLTSPVFIFLATIMGRSTGVDVNIWAGADDDDDSSGASMVDNGCASGDNGVTGSLSSVENIYRSMRRVPQG